MKVILCMAMTVNGYIATEEAEPVFVSKVAEQRFFDMAKQVGNVVIGRGTYDALMQADAFPIPDTLNVVMTSSLPEVEPLKNVLFFTESPEEAIAELARRGFEEVLLGGGGILNGSFMNDGLIDEIYLTVEPVVFSAGIHLFEHADFKRELELLGTEQISEHEVQLHYALRKYTVDAVLEEGAGD